MEDLNSKQLKRAWKLSGRTKSLKAFARAGGAFRWFRNKSGRA